MINPGMLADLTVQMQQAISPHIGPRALDEVALAAADNDAALKVCADFLIAQQGIFFNISQDRCDAEPGGFNYGVTYRFLQPHGETFRIELMTIDDGFSPAHAVAEQHFDDGFEGLIVMHVSYKPAIPGLEGYRAEKHILENAGFTLAQECTSTYGVFSYWNHSDLPPGVYLKPRVNLRDSGPILKSVNR